MRTAPRKRKPALGNPRVTAEDLTLEAHVAGACRGWLELNGWTVHRLVADKWAGGNVKKHEREENGTPDYLVRRLIPETIRSYNFYLEVKRAKGGKVSASQRAWKRLHKDEAVLYIKSLDELKAWVTANFPWSVKTR